MLGYDSGYREKCGQTLLLMPLLMPLLMHLRPIVTLLEYPHSYLYT